MLNLKLDTLFVPVRNAEDLIRQAQNILTRARKQDDEERERLRRQQEEKLAMLEKIRQEEVRKLHLIGHPDDRFLSLRLTILGASVTRYCRVCSH